MAGARPFALVVEHAKQPLEVVSFRGREALSQPYRFDLVCAGQSVEPEALASELVGAAAHLSWSQGGVTRHCHGRISRARALGLTSRAPDRWAYELRLVPAFALLAHKKNSRIFQDKTVPTIVGELLESLGLSFRARLSASYPTRRYCVQHQERDLDFVERLLAEEGIFYCFEHEPGDEAREVLVLGDGPSALDPVEGSDVFSVAERHDDLALGEADLVSFQLTRRLRPARVALRDFDHERPSFDLRAESAEGEPEPVRGGLEQYHHHAELEPRALTQGAARVRLEQHRRRLWRATAEGRSVRPRVGRTLRVDGSEVGALEPRYVVVALEHRGEDAEGRSGPTYRTRLTFAPASAPPRPPAPAPRTQQVLETATVVGPRQDEIYTDELGRIKVQFHWDREGRRDEHSSCWIRAMQPWAGAGFGFQFIPRVGMEVVVGFLAGDADRPLVLGSVFNQELLPPFNLPDEKTRSGVVTRTTPGGGGYNELSFQDLKGQEVITVHAQRDLSERVNRDHDTQVGGNAVLAVGRDHTTTVEGESRSTVGGDRLEEVRGVRHVGVTGASSKTVVGNSTERVSGHRTVDVKGLLNAKAHASASLRVGAKASLHAGGSLSVTVGSDATASGSLSTTGSWHVGADGDVVLRADKSVRIECGETVLTLLPDKLEIRAQNVDIKGTDLTLLRGKDGVLELAAEAKLAAPKTRCFGSGGSLELTSDALMKGAHIHLGVREGDPPKPVDGQEPAPTKPLALKLSDAAYQPYANRPYELVVDGVRLTGTLDGGGGLSQDIPEGATQAMVIVWVGDPPTGESVRYTIAVATLPAASSLEGARTRLQNLGYSPGTGEALDPDTELALREFQEDHELEPTGELDADTAAKLGEVSGS